MSGKTSSSDVIKVHPIRHIFENLAQVVSSARSHSLTILWHYCLSRTSTT